MINKMYWKKIMANFIFRLLILQIIFAKINNVLCIVSAIKKYKIYWKKIIQMKIVVDYRENSLIEQLQKIKSLPQNNEYNTITIETQNLQLGDVYIASSSSSSISHSNELINENESENQQNQIFTIFERKTIADLKASIKDGRYDEQYMRLSQCANIPLHNIVYIIEGNINDKLILSSMTSILYYKGCSILRTNDVKETAILLLGICKKIERNVLLDKHFYYNLLQQQNVKTSEGNIEENICQIEQKNEIDYANCIKEIKKENITKNNIGHIFLQQIPYCSSSSSKAIMEKCGNSFATLLLELKNNKNYLDNIYIESKDGKKRKLGKNVIAKIYELLID